MALERHTAETLSHSLIDIHSHAGVDLKAYSAGEYPYAQSVEGLYYRQQSGPANVNVVFPFTADLHFDPIALREGERRPATQPCSPTPYAAENHLLLREVFEYCPELAPSFLPFVCVDPAREIAAQIKALEVLLAEYPIYGIKINPVLCQSPISALQHEGGPLLDLAAANDLPLLIHVATVPGDIYSQAADLLPLIEEHTELRFCLAHCLSFHREFMTRAADLPHVWVDTSALKIQVDHLSEQMVSLGRDLFLDLDYTDHCHVMQELCQSFPDTMVWGTDAPAYAYICRRKQAEGHYHTFRLKGTYADEVSALQSLTSACQQRVAHHNPLCFLFGIGQ